MTDAKVETQVDAAADDKVVEPKTGKPHTVTTQVWVKSGPVAKNELLRTAIHSVRDAIPVVYELEAEIADAKKTKRDGEDGTLYTIAVNYTPRGDGKEDPVDPDAVIKGLEAPRFPGFHEGDPDFHSDPEHK
jgi:hypothetical protein